MTDLVPTITVPFTGVDEAMAFLEDIGRGHQSCVGLEVSIWFDHDVPDAQTADVSDEPDEDEARTRAPRDGESYGADGTIRPVPADVDPYLPLGGVADDTDGEEDPDAPDADDGYEGEDVAITVEPGTEVTTQMYTSPKGDIRVRVVGHPFIEEGGTRHRILSNVYLLNSASIPATRMVVGALDRPQTSSKSTMTQISDLKSKGYLRGDTGVSVPHAYKTYQLTDAGVAALTRLGLVIDGQPQILGLDWDDFIPIEVPEVSEWNTQAVGELLDAHERGELRSVRLDSDSGADEVDDDEDEEGEKNEDDEAVWMTPSAASKQFEDQLPPEPIPKFSGYHELLDILDSHGDGDGLKTGAVEQQVSGVEFKPSTAGSALLRLWKGGYVVRRTVPRNLDDVSGDFAYRLTERGEQAIARLGEFLPNGVGENRATAGGDE